MIFNTHTHLNSSRYTKQEIEEIMSTLKEKEMSILICGFDYDSSIDAIEIASTYDKAYVAVGFHPTDISKMNANSIGELRKLCGNNKVVAIGEIGLDLYHDKDNLELQTKYFIEQLELANELNLPVIIHSRDAGNETYDILSKYLKTKGVIHCYSYSVESMKNFLNIGMYISIAGTVTFKNAKSIKEVAATVDIDRLLVETDCPYLTPEPFRGKINKAYYVEYVIEEIAKLRNSTFENIAKKTKENALEFFNIKEK